MFIVSSPRNITLNVSNQIGHFSILYVIIMVSSEKDYGDYVLCAFVNTRTKEKKKIVIKDVVNS